MGGSLTNSLWHGSMLAVGAAWGLPADLERFIQLRRDGQLPGGCEGRTCLAPQIQNYADLLLSKRLFPFVAAIAAIVLCLCCLTCRMCCRTCCSRGQKRPCEEMAQEAEVADPERLEQVQDLDQPRHEVVEGGQEAELQGAPQKSPDVPINVQAVAVALDTSLGYLALAARRVSEGTARAVEDAAEYFIERPDSQAPPETAGRDSQPGGQAPSDPAERDSQRGGQAPPDPARRHSQPGRAASDAPSS